MVAEDSCGGRSTQGTSVRSPRQNFLIRHRNAGSQVTPDSISTTLRSGILGEHAFGDQAHDLRLKALGLGDVVLDVVARPAKRSDRVAVGTAGMNADRQAVAFGRCIDRPVLAAPERHFADRRHQHLDEARVGGAALDLRRRRIRRSAAAPRWRRAGAASGSSHSLRDPVVDGAGEGARQVFAEHGGRRRGSCRWRCGCRRGRDCSPCADRGGAAGGVAPVGPDGERRAGRITDGVQLIDAAALHAFAPMGRDKAAGRACPARSGGRRSRWRERRKTCSCAVLPSRHRRNNAEA